MYDSWESIGKNHLYEIVKDIDISNKSGNSGKISAHLASADYHCSIEVGYTVYKKHLSGYIKK